MKNRDQFSATKAFAVIELFKWSTPHNRYWTRWVFCAALFLPACIIECTFLIRVFFFPTCCVILVYLRLIIHSFCHPHTRYVSVLQCGFPSGMSLCSKRRIYVCRRVILLWDVKHPSQMLKGAENQLSYLDPTWMQKSKKFWLWGIFELF